MARAGEPGRAFREFALGLNPLLAVPDRNPWIHASRVRIGRRPVVARRQLRARRPSRGGYVRWNFYRREGRHRQQGLDERLIACARASPASAPDGAFFPRTSTIVAATLPVFLKVCFAPPFSVRTWPCVTSTGLSPSTVSVNCPVTSTNTCHVASSCEWRRRTAPGSPRSRAGRETAADRRPPSTKCRDLRRRAGLCRRRRRPGPQPASPTTGRRTRRRVSVGGGGCHRSAPNASGRRVALRCGRRYH